MRFARILKILLVVVPLLLIAAIVGGIAVLKSMDFNQYKSEITAEVNKATGRDLVIAGDLGVEISLNPVVAVEGVGFANADWGSRPEMVVIDRFEARVAVLPLLFGRLEISRLVLVGADILLEVNEEGRANFAFGEPAAADPEGEAGKMELPIGAREVAIEDSVVTVSNAVTGANYQVRIDELTLKGESLDDPVNLVFGGSYNEVPVAASATPGTPSAMLSPDSPWPVDMTLEAGGAKIEIKGAIAQPTAASGIDLAISVAGEELGDLSALAGAEVPKLGPYSLSGKLTGDAVSALTFAGLEAGLASSDLGGEINVRLDGERPAITATLTAETVDLTALGGGGGGESGKKSDKLFPADPLSLDGLKAVDAKLQLKAKAIVVAGARLEEATLGVALDGGNLVVKPIQGMLAGGAMDGSVQLDGRKKAASLMAKLIVRKIDLGRMAKEMADTDMLEGHASLKIDVAGAGSSVAAIMASLDGAAGIVMGKGRMKSAALNTLIGGPTQILSDVFTGGDSEYTAINCAVVRFPVTKGVATAEPLVLDTEVAAFVGEGTIDLGSEALALVIEPEVKKTTISAAVPVNIGGTLANPRYSLDNLAVARKVGGVLALVLFPPAAVVGLVDLGAGDDNPCVQQARGGNKEAAGDDSGGATELLNDAGKGITEGIKGLFGQ
jgi:uncharacterized protein involved in outer membrane biogenesis